MTDVRIIGEGRDISYGLPLHVPEPGEICPVCERRKPFPREAKTPETATVAFRLPTERKENLHEGLKALADVTGAAQRKYPLGTLLEALLLLGSENREHLKAFFDQTKEPL